MTFVLIDGVIANDTFSTAAAGTSSLIDGINNQQFAAPASATTQPVDAILGLTTWTASAIAICSLNWTSQNSLIAITEVSIDNLYIGLTSQNSVISLNSNLTDALALNWTSQNSLIAITEASIDSLALNWTSQNSLIAITEASIDSLALNWIDQSSTVLINANVAFTGVTVNAVWTDQSSVIFGSLELINSTVIGIQSQDDTILIASISDVPVDFGKIIHGAGQSKETEKVKKTKAQIAQELYEVLYPLDDIIIVPTAQVNKVIDKIAKRNYKSVMARNNAAVHEVEKIIKRLQIEQQEDEEFLLLL